MGTTNLQGIYLNEVIFLSLKFMMTVDVLLMMKLKVIASSLPQL